MEMKFRNTLVALTLALTALVVSCRNPFIPKEEPAKVYTLNYYLDEDAYTEEDVALTDTSSDAFTLRTIDEVFENCDSDKNPGTYKPGYEFAGWFDIEEEIDYDEEDTVSVSEFTNDVHHFVAKWVNTGTPTKIEYTIKLVYQDTEGGKVEGKSDYTLPEKFKNGNSVNLDSYISADGYTFDSIKIKNSLLTGKVYTVSSSDADSSKLITINIIMRKNGIAEIPATDFTLQTFASTMKVGANPASIKVESFVPADANSGKSLTYTSSNDSIATVSESGLVTPLAKGDVVITVALANKPSVKKVINIAVTEEIPLPPVTKTLKSLEVVSTGTAEAPAFAATAKYTDDTSKDVTASVTWTSSNPDIASISNGAVTLIAAGETVISSSYTEGSVTKTGAKQTVTVTQKGGTGSFDDKVIVFVKANSAPTLWAWELDGDPLSQKKGLTWDTQVPMVSATTEYMTDPSGWDMEDFTNQVTSGKTKIIKFKLNKSDPEITGAAQTFWYDGSSVSTTNPSPVPSGPVTLTATVKEEVIIEPTIPTITINPVSGTIQQNGKVTVTVKANNGTLSSASVKVTGGATITKTLSDFNNNGVCVIRASEIGAGKTVSIRADAANEAGSAEPVSVNITVSNEEPPVASDDFDWNNANVYFVLTDRFYNGDTKNDHSYGRQSNTTDESMQVATFHGGDLKGLTDKIDYFDDLGVNAIWITAPYEQTHGWTSGKNDMFPHYSFHGYYAQDWTCTDQNMGTVEELRTFVNTCHEKGIRVIMDVVMNHTGYDTWQDMIDYDFGGFLDNPLDITKYTSACFKTDGKYVKGDHEKWGTDYSVTTNQGFDKWWSSWCRGFDGNGGYEAPGGDDLKLSLAGLPDVVTEKTTKVNIPTFLAGKWESEQTMAAVPVSNGNTTGNTYGDYYNPSVKNVDWGDYSGDWRTDQKGAPADYIIVWLSAWVREVGIDGFRCDTAKHVEKSRWNQLKQAAQAALEAWRQDTTKSKGNSDAANWTQTFWTTGEAWGYTGGQDAYFTEGGFDSMIDFSYTGITQGAGASYGSYYPKSDSWQNRNGVTRNFTGISSHDTKLTRGSDQRTVGTGLVLLPGPIQIYYGDESKREIKYTSYGDGDMCTRGDMNFGENTESVAHWGKLGNFRKYNPAVGAGVVSNNGTVRKYSKNGVENNVVIGISGTSVTVSDCFEDGTTVYNWYDGESATVSDGSVTFAGGTETQPILVSDRNPADYR